MPKRKPPKLSFVAGLRKTEQWKDTLRRRCEEVYDDKEETTEKKNEMIQHLKAVGGRQCTEYLRIMEFQLTECSEPGRE